MKIQAFRLRNILAVIWIMAGVAASDVFGQQMLTANAEMSNSESAKKADEFLAKWDKKDMPGCGVGAVKDGQLVYKRGLGMANLDYDVPNTPSTLFNVASVSKAFTAASIVLLAQQGKLSLDDEVQKYLTEIPKYDHPVTLRHMLHHTSGLREYQALMLFGGHNSDNAISEKQVLGMLARQRGLSFRPGTKYQYSNSNYQLLGAIVARVSGKSLRAFADENIFKPLGMKNTRYFDNRNEVVKNRASGYMVGQDNSVRVRASLFDLVGGGGVLTTVEDMYLWDQNFHEPKVGGREMAQLLTAPGVLNDGEKINYGFGLFTNEYRGIPVFKHSGNMSGYRAQTITFPEKKFTAIALCNNSAILPHLIIEKLADIYLDGQFPAAAAKSSKVDIASLPAGTPIPETEAVRYAGIFVNTDIYSNFRLSMREGKLFMSGLAKGELPVTRTAEGRLVMVEGDSRYEMVPVLDKAGAVSEMKLPRSSGQADVFVRVKAPFDLPQKLAEYAGTYHSEEFNNDFVIRHDGGKFALRISESFEAPLAAAYEDVLTAANGQISLVFARGDNGKITGFVFNAGLDGREVKGVVFKRR
jgi:CubicO group peptidase (beta-lactamase class C family)